MTRDWEEAVKRGDVARLEELIGHGADVDARDRHDQTALMLSARSGHEEAALLLIRRGADLNHSAKYHLTALMLAVINGHTGIVRHLVDAGADTAIEGTGAPGFHGKNALALAEAQGCPEIARILRAASRAPRLRG